jgi:hypothetical protein
MPNVQAINVGLLFSYTVRGNAINSTFYSHFINILLG